MIASNMLRVTGWAEALMNILLLYIYHSQCTFQSFPLFFYVYHTCKHNAEDTVLDSGVYEKVML